MCLPNVSCCVRHSTKLPRIAANWFQWQVSLWVVFRLALHAHSALHPENVSRKEVFNGSTDNTPPLMWAIINLCLLQPANACDRTFHYYHYYCQTKPSMGRLSSSSASLLLHVQFHFSLSLYLHTRKLILYFEIEFYNTKLNSFLATGLCVASSHGMSGLALFWTDIFRLLSFDIRLKLIWCWLLIGVIGAVSHLWPCLGVQLVACGFMQPFIQISSCCLSGIQILDMSIRALHWHCTAQWN